MDFFAVFFAAFFFFIRPPTSDGTFRRPLVASGQTPSRSMETNDCRGEDTDIVAGEFRTGIAHATAWFATLDFRGCSNRYLRTVRKAFNANI